MRACPLPRVWEEVAEEGGGAMRSDLAAEGRRGHPGRKLGMRSYSRILMRGFSLQGKCSWHCYMEFPLSPTSSALIRRFVCTGRPPPILDEMSLKLADHQIEYTG